MPYVPDKLVSPLSTAVLAYITNTNSSWKPKGRGKYAIRNLNEIWGRVKADLQNARKLGRAHRHHIHNQFCAEEIARNAYYLTELKNVFITSLSVDFTPIDESLNFYPGHPAGWDPICNLNRVNRELGAGIQKYSVQFEEIYKQRPRLKHVFWPVSPYLFGYRFVQENGKMIVRHIFPDTIERTNDLMSELGYREYGDSEKEIESNEPQLGNYEWSDILIVPGAAKRATIGLVPGGKGYDLRFVYNSIPYILDANVREKIKQYKEKNPLRKDITSVLDRNFEKEINYNDIYNQVIDWATFLNRQIIADFLEKRLIQPLKLKTLELAAEKTGYVNDVMKFYGKKYELGWWKVMDNADMPREGLADKSAVNRIVGVMYGNWIDWRT